jgi:hypothetical protein
VKHNNKVNNEIVIIPTKPIAKMSSVELMDFVKQIAPNKHFYPRTTLSARVVAQKLYDKYLQTKNIQAKTK